MTVLPGLGQDVRVLLSSAEQQSQAPLYQGYGDVDLCCGDCGLVLAEGLRAPSQFSHIVLECPQCRALNRGTTEA